MATLSDESAISKLPAELLETILLEVVSDSISPDKHHPRTEGITRQPNPVKGPSGILTCRFTSKAFHEMSWRALARVVDHTVFDLKSWKSMENLEAVAACLQLPVDFEDSYHLSRRSRQLSFLGVSSRI